MLELMRDFDYISAIVVSVFLAIGFWLWGVIFGAGVQFAVGVSKAFVLIQLVWLIGYISPFVLWVVCESIYFRGKTPTEKIVVEWGLVGLFCAVVLDVTEYAWGSLLTFLSWWHDPYNYTVSASIGSLTSGFVDLLPFVALSFAVGLYLRYRDDLLVPRSE